MLAASWTVCPIASRKFFNQIPALHLCFSCHYFIIATISVFFLIFPNPSWFCQTQTDGGQHEQDDQDIPRKLHDFPTRASRILIFRID